MMKGWNGSKWIAVLAATGLALAAGAATAEDFPTREVTIISPWAAGGQNDTLSRAIAQNSETFLGKPIIVENMPGGGGVVGNKYVERAKKDGYILLMASSSTVFTQYSSSSPNDIKKLGPVIDICNSPHFLVSSAKAPWKNLQDFLADAKANPGKVTVSTSGAGGSSDLYTTLLEKEAGIKVTKVPYAGSAPAMTAVLGGHIGATIVPPAVAGQYVVSGQARALAVATEKRYRDFPDVPTFKEQGVDLVIHHWIGLMGPADLPQDRVDILVKAFKQGMKTPAFQSLLQKQGFDEEILTGADFQKFIDQEDERWKAIIKK